MKLQAGTFARCAIGISCLTTALPMMSVQSAEAVSGHWSAPVLVDPAAGGLTAVSCAPGGFCVGVDSFGNAAVRREGAWEHGVSIDPGRKLIDVSCATSRFCMAISDNDLIRFSDGAWGQPEPIRGMPRQPTTLTSISCPTAHFCAVVDSLDQVRMYNGHSWSSPVQVPLAPFDDQNISCTSATRCVVADSLWATIYDGSTWSASTEIDEVQAIADVVCRSKRLCIAMDNDGGVVYLRAGQWSDREQVQGAAHILALDCAPHGSVCVAVGLFGLVATYTADEWSVGTIDDGRSLVDVSCSAVSFCAAVDYFDQAVTFDGAEWTSPTKIVNQQGGMQGLSCISDGFCGAVDESGSALTYDGIDWTEPSSVTRARLVAVSCAAADFCVAVGGGYAYAYNGMSWDAGTRLDAGAQLTGVSCVSTTFCMAVDRQGYAMTYDGSSWSAPERFSTYSDQGIDVSCPSTTFCVAVNGHWSAFTYDGTTWSAAQALPKYSGNYTEPYVSCPAVQHCVAIESVIGVLPVRFLAVTLTEGGWSKLVDADAHGHVLSGVSCATIDVCVAIDDGGEALRFDSSGWGAPKSIDPGHDGLTGISCTGGSCVAVDEAGYALHQ